MLYERLFLKQPLEKEIGANGILGQNYLDLWLLCKGKKRIDGNKIFNLMEAAMKIALVSKGGTIAMDQEYRQKNSL